MCVILVLVYAHVWAACLQVLALVLTQGQRCLSMLSVLTDVRLWGGVRGLEASAHWRHTPQLNRTSIPPHTHTSAETQTCIKMHKRIFWDVYKSWVHSVFHMHPSAYTNTFDPPNTLRLYSSPSALHHQPFGGIYLPIHPSIHPSIDCDKLTSDPSDLCPLTALSLANSPIPHIINIREYQVFLTRPLIHHMCWISAGQSCVTTVYLLFIIVFVSHVIGHTHLKATLVKNPSNFLVSSFVD